MWALRHHFPGNDDGGSPASRIPRYKSEPFDGWTKALILVIAHPRSALAKVEDKEVPARAQFDLEVFPRTCDEAFNNVVLPQVCDPRARRLRRDVRRCLV